MIVMLAPRTSRISPSSSFITERAVADLPEPDSPTSATVSPRRISNDTRSTARSWRVPWRKATERSRTSSSGAVVESMEPSPERLARIEGVAHRLADEDKQRQHGGDGKEAGQAEP